MEKKETPVFGFVVPVYNTKKEYLDKCITSLIKQTYPYVKVVLVDDGSRVEIASLCDEWSLVDNRIVSIHHENNLGLPASRNTGLENIETEWVTFIDSDDWIDEDACERLKQSIEVETADIFLFSGYRNHSDKQIECAFHYPHNAVFARYEERERLQKQMFLDQTKECVVGAFPIQSACPRLYSVAFLRQKNVRFIDVRFSEDALMHMYGIEAADRVVYLQERLYHYRDTPDSMVNSFRVNADKEQLSVMNALWSFAENANKNTDFKKLMYIFSFMSMQMCIWSKFYNPMNTGMTSRVRRIACKTLFSIEPYCSTLNMLKTLPLRRLRRNQIIKYYLMRLHMYNALTWMRSKYRKNV